MEYIAHRINTVRELGSLPGEYGVELDLRDSSDNRVYIQHNPFETGEDFEEYLKEYRHGTMILNVKSERIEHKVLELVSKYDVKSYFFLDSSFPMIWLLSSQGVRNIALRVSEFEGLDTARNMAGKAGWIWVDCFTKMPISAAQCGELHSLGYKLCIVSPELQGRKNEVSNYAGQLKKMGVRVDAVCTKKENIAVWKNMMEQRC